MSRLSSTSHGQQFSAAIIQLSELTATDAVELTAPLEIGYTDQRVTQLLSALLRRLQRQAQPELERALLSKNTRVLINTLRRIQPSTLRSLCPAEQLDTIQTLLEILGFENARCFPLLAHEAKTPIVSKDSIGHLRHAHLWVQATTRLLERTYRRELKLDARARLGILCIWLALMSGVASSGEMRIALIELQAGRIRRHGNLLWTSGCYEKRRNERRRQWLTEEIVLLASSINWHEAGFTKTGAPQAVRAALASLARLDPGTFATLNRSSLLKASTARAFYEAKLPAFILEYMRGDIGSSSLPESVLARLLGMSPTSWDQQGDNALTQDSARNDKPDPVSPAEALASTRPTARPTVLKRLSQMLHTSAPSAKKQIQTFIREARENDDLPGLVDQLLEWCSLSLSSRKPRTVKTALDKLMPRLLGNFEGLEAISDPEVWADLVQHMTAEPDEAGNALSAISGFARYLTEQHGEEFATAGSSGLSSINAQVLTVQEIHNASLLLKQNLGPGLGKLAATLLKLSFSTGLRRSEIDGLLVSDIEFVRTAALRVRKNEHRTLKTSNAKRNIPLGLAESLFADVVTDLAKFAEQPNCLSGTSRLIFEQFGHEPLVDPHRIFNAISSALQQVTGESKAKLHSLRHSYCCLLLLSFFYEHLELERYEDLLPYLREIRELGVVTRAQLNPSGAVHRFELATVRGLLGHLTEQTTLMHYYHWCDFMRYAGFTREQCLVKLSLQAQLAAAGKNQNTRGPGKHIGDLTAVKADVIGKFCKPLLPREQNALDQKVEAIKRTELLKNDLVRAMTHAGHLVAGKAPGPLVLDGLGPIPEGKIQAGIRWLDRTFLQATYGREFPSPYKQLTDAGAGSCLLAMLNNLVGKSESDLTRLAAGLRQLLEHRSEPYLSYLYEDHAQLMKAGAMIQEVLAGFPYSFAVTIEVKIGRRYDKRHTSSLDLLDLPDVPSARYRVRMHRGSSEQFPHRALVWLVTALSICTAGLAT